MKIEVLYPEVCCLFGDKANARYLSCCMPQADFVYTALSDEPAFVREDVAMIYLASLSESSQSILIETLAPYRARLAELIDKGCVILATGNAFEIFGKSIATEKDEVIPALDLIDITTKRQIPKRSNSLFLGLFESQTIVGYTSRFAHSFYGPDAKPLFHVEKGYGMNLDDKTNEGVRKNNFFGTHLLGPLLVQNPDFNLYLQKLMGVENPSLAWEDAVREALDVRLKEFNRDIVFYD